MLLTSGYSFEGYDIVSYIGHESAQIVLGTGIFSSFDVSVSDLFGMRSNAYENKLDSAEQAGKERLMDKARNMGGNAIIGIDVDYTTFSKDVIGVIVGGTIVKIEKRMQEKEVKRICNMEYNTSVPLKILDSIIVSNIDADKIYISLYGKSYFNNKIKGLEVKIIIETIFGRVVEIPDVVFADIHIDNENAISTEYNNLKLDSSVFKTIKHISVQVVRCITDSDEIIEASASQNKKVDFSQEQLMDVRKFYGIDAVNKAHKTDAGWMCYCGMENENNKHICQFCGRDVQVETLRPMSDNNSNDIFDLCEYMDIIDSFGNSKEIYEYLKSINCSDIYFNSVVLPEIKKITDCERLYGSMKNSAINKLQELCLKDR